MDVDDWQERPGGLDAELPRRGSDRGGNVDQTVEELVEGGLVLVDYERFAEAAMEPAPMERDDRLGQQRQVAVQSAAAMEPASMERDDHDRQRPVRRLGVVAAMEPAPMPTFCSCGDRLGHESGC